MPIALHVVAAAALVTVALYVQHRIPAHTAGRTKVLVTRAALAGVGIALGYVAARLAPEEPAAILLFLQGFGLVHLPAAFILFFKRARGEGRS